MGAGASTSMDLAQKQLTTLVYIFDTASTYLRRNPRASPKSRSKFSHHTSYPSRTNTIVKLGRLSLTNAKRLGPRDAKTFFFVRRQTIPAKEKRIGKTLSHQRLPIKMLATENLPRLLAHERKSRGPQGRSFLSGNCLLFLGSQETRGQEDVRKGNGQDTVKKR